MMTAALFTLFALGALVSLLVLADSGMRAVDAWHRLRGELRTLSGKYGSARVQQETPWRARVVRMTGQNVMRSGWRAAA